MKRAPGPRGGWLGSYGEYRRDPLGFFLGAAREHGDLVRFRFFHKPAYLVVGPRLIRRVLQDNARNYAKGVSYEALRTLLGNGLLVSEGELWKRQRRLAQPAFHPQELGTKLDLIASCVGELVQRWGPRARSGEPFNLVPEMMRLAFDVVGRALMGGQIAAEMDEIERVLNETVEVLYRRMEAPVKLPLWIPTPASRRFLRGKRTLEGVVSRVIERHRAHGESTLLGTLMRARDEETGAGMSDRQLRDEVLTFLLAGHETTGDALCWAFLLLSRHAEARRRVAEEVDSVLEGRTPRPDDLERLAYIGQVLDETMRLYPPAWSFTRRPVEDDLLDDFRIEREAIVIVSPYVNHRLPRFWEDPERFDPDRFEPARAERLEPYVYFPFGGGGHACVGRHFSLIEARVALAMISRKYEIRVASEAEVSPLPRISLRPSGAIPVTIRER